MVIVKMTCLHCGDLCEIMDNEDLEFHTGLSCAVSKDPSCNLPECVLRRNEEITKLKLQRKRMQKTIRSLSRTQWSKDTEAYIGRANFVGDLKKLGKFICCPTCCRVKSDTCCDGPKGRRVQK